MKSLFGLLVAAPFALASAAVAVAQQPPLLRLERDLRIDAVEHDLSPIGFIAVSPNGTMAIAQSQDALIRYFDANGKPLGTFGRKGQGPGEFERVGRATWVADTLVVNDILRRLTFISPDRKLVRVQSWLPAIKVTQSGSTAPRFTMALPFAIYPDGDQLVSSSLARGSPLPDWPGADSEGPSWMRVDSSGVLRHVVAWAAAENCSVPLQEGRGVAAIPFCSTGRREVSPDGARMALSWAERGRRIFHLVVIRATGDTVFQRTYPYRPILISKSEREKAIASASLSPFPGVEEALEKADFPDRAPVARIVLGRDETTWLELTTVTGDRMWNVLDANGEVVGRVRLNRNLYPMVVSRDVVWATETDDNGLQHIVRYRITR